MEGRVSPGNVGRDPTKQFEGQQSLTIKNKQALAAQKKTARSVISPSTTTANKIIALGAGLVVPGGSMLYKKAIDANTIFAPKKKTKKPIVESSSEEESEEEEPLRPPSPPLEPETFKELQNYQEPVQTYDKPKPRLKFAFA